MTTVAVVKKAGIVAIAADTLTKWGSAKESAEYVANHEKILVVGENYLGMSGSAAYRHVLAEYFSRNNLKTRLSTVGAIFRAWNDLHAALKEHYFLNATDDKEEGLESSGMDVLIANPHGIFGAAADRTVQEYSKFYAYGTGADYALGALYATYEDSTKDAADLARFAVRAAAEFDDATGLPVDCYTVALASG